MRGLAVLLVAAFAVGCSSPDDRSAEPTQPGSCVVRVVSPAGDEEARRFADQLASVFDGTDCSVSRGFGSFPMTPGVMVLAGKGQWRRADVLASTLREVGVRNVTRSYNPDVPEWALLIGVGPNR